LWVRPRLTSCSRIGLVNRLAPAGQALSAAIALAEILASRPALALSLIRAGVRDSLNQTTLEAIDRTLADSHRVFTGPDIEEGINAFFDRRAPVFTAGRNDAGPGGAVAARREG